MAEWWQSPAYLERQAAGEVVTPGLVDWGGMGNDLYKFLQAPYEARVAREAAAARPEPPAMQDPLEVMSRANYVPTPRFGTLPPKVAPSPKVWQGNTIPGPTPVSKSQDRMAAQPVGLPPGYGSGYTATPRFSTASLSGEPNYGGYKATPRFSTASAPKAPPDYKGYVATPRFGTASGRTGESIIDLSGLDMSDRGAQNTADSEGKPVRTKTGVYYPGGKGPVATSGGGAPRAAVAPARSGGLFGSLFGGGNSGGLFGGGSGRAPVAITVTGGNPAPAAPGPTYTTTPFQEDRFQTTTGAGMPASMNNSRWTTGY